MLRAFWRCQLVCSKAFAMAAASASFLTARAKNFKPPVSVWRRGGFPRFSIGRVVDPQFREGQILVAQHQVAPYEIFELAQIARPGVAQTGLNQLRTNLRAGLENWAALRCMKCSSRIGISFFGHAAEVPE